MTGPVCDQHHQPACLVVTYYEPAGDRYIKLDQLACNEECAGPRLAGLERSWFALTAAGGAVRSEHPELAS